MITFQDNEENWKRLDFEIISRGFYKPYIEYSDLKADLEWLKSEKYNIIEFDCYEWKSNKSIMHDSFESRFNFPPYYGKNWDALQECLNELEITDSGLVVVFDNLDFLNIKMAHTLLDVFITSSRKHLIFQNKLLALIKVSNKNYKLDPLSSIDFNWY